MSNKRKHTTSHLPNKKKTFLYTISQFHINFELDKCDYATCSDNFSECY